MYLRKSARSTFLIIRENLREIFSRKVRREKNAKGAEVYLINFDLRKSAKSANNFFTQRTQEDVSCRVAQSFSQRNAELCEYGEIFRAKTQSAQREKQDEN
jgi:hypothetical protein